jgi:hypothetical protein
MREAMEIFRKGHDEYGRVLTDGLSWDLLPVAFWAAVVIILVHLIASALTAGRRRGNDEG